MAIIGFLFILGSAAYFIERYGGWIIALVFLVIGLVFLSVFLKRHPRLKKVRMKDISQPEARPITGSFKCKTCGGITKIENEMNPSPDCKFCGAPLLDLMFSIQKRNDDLKYEYKRNIMEAEQKNREIYENKLERLKEESIERSRIRNKNLKEAAIALGVVAAVAALLYAFIVHRF